MPRSTCAFLVAGVVATLSVLGLPAASAADDGMIRLAHLSPDTPSVDVYVDNVADPHAMITLPGVGYGAVSSYRHVPPGTYAVSFRAAGANPATPPVLSTTVEISPGAARTVAGVGFFRSLKLAVFEDDLSLPPAGSARVRVLSGATPTVDVSAAGTPIASQLAMGKAGDYVVVPGGRTTLQVTSSGGSPTPVPMTLEAGCVYSLLVLDRQGGGLAVTRVLDAAGMPEVPMGGVETGVGGTAPGPVSMPVAVAAFAALVLLGTFARPLRRGLPRRGARR